MRDGAAAVEKKMGKALNRRAILPVVLLALLAFLTAAARPYTRIFAEEAADGPVAFETYTDTANWLSYESESLASSDAGISLGAYAAYKKPLAFDTRIKIGFTINPSAGDGWVAFGLVKTATVVTDFGRIGENAGLENDGLYFMVSASGYNITCTYNGVFRYLGNASMVSGIPFGGYHSVEIIKGSSGIIFRFDGVNNISGELATVDTACFLGAEGTYLAYGFHDIGATVLSRLTYIADNRAPVFDEYEETMSAVVNSLVEVPILTAEDETDGACLVSYTLYDPYGREMTLRDPEFRPLYIGEYQLVYTARDTSGNVATAETYIDVTGDPDLPAFWTDGVPPSNGRTGVQIVLPEYHVGEYGSVQIAVTAPSGLEQDITVSGKFTPQEIGRYSVDYTVSGGAGKFMVTYFIVVKINYGDADTMSLDAFGDTKNWVQAADGALASADDGITASGNAYYKYPLDMSVGLHMTFDITALSDKSKVDCWMSIALLQYAGHGDFASHNIPGIYLMVYNDGGTLRYNAGTYNYMGEWVFCGTGVIGSAGQTKELDIKIYKYNEGNVQYYDSIILIVNGARNTQFDMYNIHYSDIVDDENFTFLTMARFGGSGAADTAFKLKRIKVVDIVLPVISIPDYPLTAKIGDKIDISKITAEDNDDPNPVLEIRIVTPDSFLILGNTLEDGMLTLEKAGKYTITVTATDESGNYDFAVLNITVSEAEGGCKSAVAGGQAALITAMLAAALIICKIRTKRLKEGL